MSFCFPVILLAFSLLLSEPAGAATELEQRARVSKSAQRSFLASDFARLERVAAQYRRHKSRTVSGSWNLTLFYTGIDEAIEGRLGVPDRDAAFQALEQKTKRWTQAYPESPTGYLVHGSLLLSRAWAYRGGGYASTVNPESWVPFGKYVEEARAYLESCKPVASADPKWYELMLIVARAQDWHRSEFDALLNEALDREPFFYQTYFSALEYLLPKWHGNIREIEQFALDAADRTRKEEGFGMYARIYWYASRSQFKNDIFNNSLVDWSRMKVGFEDIISRYPDAWNLNNYARFACLAGDKPKTAELLNRIKTAVIAEAWKPLSLKQTCADWAVQA